MTVLIIVLFIALIWLIRKLALNIEEGTAEQRERNPELNTKNFDMHEMRLEKFSKSKYKNRVFYIGTDGTCYYYSATGKKIYC
tara:strand:+ start:1015 stop:1263 length:249 start_codon:yes stop_codon:yes gene_type:complete